MVDLTINRKDKKDFIINVDTINDRNFYIIKYANKKTSNLFKSEENEKKLLRRLEEQFLSKKDEYKEFTKYLKITTIIISLYLSLGVSLASFYIHYNLSDGLISTYFDSVYNNVILSLYNIFLVLYNLIVSFTLDEKQKRINIIEKFLKYKEEFSVLLYKFSNGKELSYSPVDLINIDNFNSLEEIYDFVEEAITDSKEDLMDMNKFNSEEEIHNYVSGKIEKEKAKLFTYSLESE